jgi:hypothetical protein
MWKVIVPAPLTFRASPCNGMAPEVDELKVPWGLVVTIDSLTDRLPPVTKPSRATVNEKAPLP